MTIEEIRDELAMLSGWYIPTQAPEQWWNGGISGIGGVLYSHPIPATLEEAAKLPEGWTWMRLPSMPTGRLVWHAFKQDLSNEVPDTGSELYDRFLLRLRCEQAEKGKQ